MRAVATIALAVLSVWLSGRPVLAEKRVALVIGMSRYQQVPRLTNPARDAEAMSSLFKKAGFDVVDSERDLGISDLRRVIREFSEISRDADISVVYYAGHGIEVEGTNYLVPADAKLLSDFDVEDETVSLDRVLKALDPVKRLKLVTRTRENRTCNARHADRFRRKSRRGGERRRRTKQPVRNGACQAHR
jgi:hypothetical protein